MCVAAYERYVCSRHNKQKHEIRANIKCDQR